ncbi:MAG: hypothetical protein AAGF79_17020 [Pseudomonadota bacterium]
MSQTLFSRIGAGLLVSATLAAGPVLAETEVMRGPGSTDIFEVNAHTIDVLSNLGQERGWWCSAVKYARHHHMDWSTRVYVESGPSPSTSTASGEIVRFTYDAAASGVTPAAESEAIARGNWLTITEANRGCTRIDNPRND